MSPSPRTGRRPLVLLAGALLVAGCGRSGPPAAAAPRSVLLVTIDTLRADHLTAERMPQLWRLAGEGVRFAQAVSVGPVTLPAHASLLTARYPTRHGVRDNGIFTLPPNVPTIAERIRARGYATGAFVSAVVLDSRHGLDRGFDTYDDEVGEAERPAGATLGRAQAWIDSARAPFFAWIHLFEPHSPYRSGSYAGEVALVDRELGALLDRLRASRLWPDLVVAVLADHGESLGEHGEQTHGFFLYDSTLRIPWVLRAPGLAPAVVPWQVRIVDVMPTVAALAGARDVVPPEPDGIDLGPALAGGRAPDLDAFAETWLPRYQFNWSELQAIRNPRLKLIAAPSGQPVERARELYDPAADPGERTDLAGTRPADADRAASALAKVRTRAGASAPAATDSKLADRLLSLGYVGAATTIADATMGAVLPLPAVKLPVYLDVMTSIDALSSGRPEQALAAADGAIAKDPSVAQAHFLRGTVLGQQGRFREAAAALERTLEISPTYATARFKLALAYLRLGDTARAERTLELVVRNEATNARALHNLAAIAYTRGDLPRAEALERQAIAADPDYVEAWNTLGAIHVVRRAWTDAIDALERARTLAPTNAQVLANLALAMRGAGRTAEADLLSADACRRDSRYCGQ